MSDELQNVTEADAGGENTHCPADVKHRAISGNLILRRVGSVALGLLMFSGIAFGFYQNLGCDARFGDMMAQLITGPVVQTVDVGASICFMVVLLTAYTALDIDDASIWAGCALLLGVGNIVIGLLVCWLTAVLFRDVPVFERTLAGVVEAVLLCAGGSYCIVLPSIWWKDPESEYRRRYSSAVAVLPHAPAEAVAPTPPEPAPVVLPNIIG